MKLPRREKLDALLKVHRISKRLQRDIRYVPEEIANINERDFLAARTKSGAEGVLLYGNKVIPFSISKRSANTKGRIEAIICDICATWRRGTDSAVITFQKSDKVTISHLVCADLDCSLHVRSLTDASRVSRTQLREDILPKQRVERLQKRLSDMLSGW